MKALGSRVGEARAEAQRSTLAGALREQGRQELESLLIDPDPHIRLRAASVVASYSPEQSSASPSHFRTGRPAVSIAVS
jgi:hypothetical protein